MATPGQCGGSGDREDQSAVDEKPEGNGAEHVRTEGLGLDGFECCAEAPDLARIRLVRCQQEESPRDADGEGLAQR
jgi:hypothetical protein